MDEGSFVEYGAFVTAAARMFQIDDVIDPAGTRSVIASALATATINPSGKQVDTW